ncbi:MAG: HDIG domain-containing protein [Clostridia bacterium]|nr:HDIG domain-containing protein [Clostridia bacterium]
MTVTKLSNKDIVKSVSAFILGALGIVLMIIIMVALNQGFYGGPDTASFLRERGVYIALVAVVLTVLVILAYLFFVFENKHVLTRLSKITEIFLLLYISLLISFILGKSFKAAAARPLFFFALMAAMLFRRRDGLFLNTVFSLMMLIIDRFVDDLTGIEMYDAYAGFLSAYCGGILAIFMFRRVKTRIGSVLIGLTLLIPVEAINMILHIPSGAMTLRQALDQLLYGALDCIFSVMLFMILLPVFEWVFAELTVFRLRELTSDDAKVIKMLKSQAPGTYNHSVVVAQLVEACAREIGEDPELARAAAFYHDVGKLKSPEMFTENQSEFNFHAELSPELSVDIIRSHAKDGAKLIKQHHLPDFFADICLQHHGTLPIKYFYIKALKLSDGELNIENYSYAGPVPTTKIAAVIMIADASEAASRSLPDRSPEKVEALVRSLIEERLDLDQFVDCNITMRELSVIKSTIVNQLTGVYHSRISYPKLTVSKKK